MNRKTLVSFPASLWVMAAMIAAACLSFPAFATAASCASAHWIGAWADRPSAASGGTTVSDIFDASGHQKLPVDNETIRAVLTPTYGGKIVRIHLSNRFGTTSAMFGRVTIAVKGTGAALAGPATPVTFAGGRSITVAPGQDVVSAPVRFAFSAMQTLAVSMYVSNDAGKPTEHYTARQTSYLSASGAGDHAGDRSAAAFTAPTTTRPYVDGIDVLAPASAGSVAAFGDSITDGYQGEPAGVPEVASTLNVNGRWPDDLARRLIAAHIPLSVLNEGISGNRVLQDGAVGGNYDTYGPSALSRLNADVLAQAGVTTVIWLEGINDLGQTPNATAAQLEAGYVKGINRMHKAGLRVLMGTLTPSGGAAGAYGTSATNAIREQVNTWIRTKSPADGYIDFDAAVRDPGSHSIINPAYDGGDHLHFNLAGYRAMADAIRLSLLRRASCTLPALRLNVSPHTATTATRTVLRFQVTTRRGGHTLPIRGAVISIGRLQLRTNAHGRARIALTFTHAGRVRARATDSGYQAAIATINTTRSSTESKPG